VWRFYPPAPKTHLSNHDEPLATTPLRGSPANAVAIKTHRPLPNRDFSGMPALAAENIVKEESKQLEEMATWSDTSTHSSQDMWGLFSLEWISYGCWWAWAPVVVVSVINPQYVSCWRLPHRARWIDIIFNINKVQIIHKHYPLCKLSKHYIDMTCLHDGW
jgi:hypothetical protein